MLELIDSGRFDTHAPPQMAPPPFDTQAPPQMAPPPFDTQASPQMAPPPFAGDRATTIQHPPSLPTPRPLKKKSKSSNGEKTVHWEDIDEEQSLRRSLRIKAKPKRDSPPVIRIGKRRPSKRKSKTRKSNGFYISQLFLYRLCLCP